MKNEFLGGTSAKSVFVLLWTVITVRGRLQVPRVYLQLSNLECWVWLQNGREINNLWLTNKRDPVSVDHLARAAFIF